MIPYILGVDTETTGLEVENGDKIIEIALIKYDLDGAKLEEFVQRIDPERNIDPKAQAVHGISYSDLIGCPKFVDIAEERRLLQMVILQLVKVAICITTC
ncbi:exonuclease domain-containing protein [Acinetobacter baumannii]|nr:exonuclease domain-containing protein [Acinetobacter baumannii]